MLAFSLISRHWDGTGTWSPSSRKSMTHLYGTVNAMVADDLATQRAMAALAKGLAHFARVILASAPEGLNPKIAAIFQTLFSNAFSWMKLYALRLRFHCFFPKSPIRSGDYA